MKTYRDGILDAIAICEQFAKRDYDDLEKTKDKSSSWAILMEARGNRCDDCANEMRELIGEEPQ